MKQLLVDKGRHGFTAVVGDVQRMEVRMMGKHKIFYSVADIACDLSISEGEAVEIVKRLHKELKASGKLVVSGRVPAAWYETQKAEGFMAIGQQAERIPLTEKRLLNIKEFCRYSGLGRDAAYKIGERMEITKRNGRKVLFDRVLFDEWCNDNRSADL